MDPNSVVLDISSDEEPDGNDRQEVYNPQQSVKKSMSSPAGKKVQDWDDDDDDCVILDGDPDKMVSVEENQDDGSDELVVVGEKGQIACRDYPHARHLCVKYPFSSTVHNFHCEQCHCYVCDVIAPCNLWGTGMSDMDHCHATDKHEVWKTERKNFMLKRCFSLPAAIQVSENTSSFVPPPVMIQISNQVDPLTRSITMPINASVCSVPSRPAVCLRTSAPAVRHVPSAPAVRHVPSAPVVRLACSAPVVRTVPSAPAVRHVPSATVVRPARSAPVVRHVPSATVVRHVPSAPAVGHVPSAPAVRHVPSAPVVRPARSAPVVRTVPSAPVVRPSPSEAAAHPVLATNSGYPNINQRSGSNKFSQSSVSQHLPGRYPDYTSQTIRYRNIQDLGPRRLAVLKNRPTYHYGYNQPQSSIPSSAQNTSWSPPEEGYVKVNSDGAWEVSADEAGIGFIGRDYSGIVEFAGACVVRGLRSAAEAEGTALMLAMKEAEKRGYRKAIFSTDNIEIVLYLLRGYKVGSSVPSWFAECRILMERNREWKLQHVLRETNKEVDYLAHKAKTTGWSWRHSKALPICLSLYFSHVGDT
ncbi:unnamed protein product [Rhodiola kirilowii]